MTIWADAFFLLNAALDYLLLAAAVRLRGGILCPKRLLLAALVGGAIALISLYVPGWPVQICGFFLLCICAFGICAEAVRRGLLFLGLSLALCGMQELLSALFSMGVVFLKDRVLLQVSWRSLLAAMGALYGACSFLSGNLGRVRRKLVVTTIRDGKQSIAFPALVDTGNFLQDPLSGKPVLLADQKIAGSLLGLSRQQLRAPTETIAILQKRRPDLRPRLIPFQTVGTGQGILLGVKIPSIQFGREMRSGAILAFSPEEISKDGSYHGLIGGSL